MKNIILLVVLLLLSGCSKPTNPPPPAKMWGGVGLYYETQSSSNSKHIDSGPTGTVVLGVEKNVPKGLGFGAEVAGKVDSLD